MNFKLFKLIDYGKSILDVEKIIEATKHMKKSKEVRDIMLNLKKRIVDELIEEYSHIDEEEPESNEPMYSVENSSYKIEDNHVIIPDEHKTLEQLMTSKEDPMIKQMSKEILKNANITKKKNAYSRK